MTGYSLATRKENILPQEPQDEAERAEAAGAALNPLSYVPLVRSIAGQMLRTMPKQLEMDDLVQAGMLGLLDAFQKYDKRKQKKFTTYAYFRIRGAILDSLRSDDWCPRELRKTARRLRQTEHTLTHELGRTPEADELAAEMSMELNEYHALRAEMHSASIGSLEAFMETWEDPARQSMADLRQTPEDDAVVRKQRTERVADCIQQLAEREKMVLTLYYFEELTMKEIAEVLGVGESRVSQIHVVALERLREALAGY